ncbi:2'-5' RNA ligase family protein [Nocardia paucivorans]|uniref:2'-5' RNA ligase family protein n=1 Tax=Nocardia paucivorans TaxID=114259 RepID=UPI0002EE1303|nr:2'-5' RNA ligase family protein [Nocardia paucivorans]
MVQSVELVLDETSEETIRRQWEMLIEAGLPSLGRSGSTDHGAAAGPRHRPHITVGVAAQIWPRIEHALEELQFRPFPVRLGGVLVFGARRPILVRLVVPSEPLLGWHRRIYQLLEPCPGVPANLRPDHWTPHITLARRILPHRLGEAVRAVASDRDSTATVVGIRRWDGDQRRAWPITEVE